MSSLVTLRQIDGLTRLESHKTNLMLAAAYMSGGGASPQGNNRALIMHCLIYGMNLWTEIS